MSAHEYQFPIDNPRRRFVGGILLVLGSILLCNFFFVTCLFISNPPTGAGSVVLYLGYLGIIALLFLAGSRSVRSAAVIVTPDEIQITRGGFRSEHYPLRELRSAFVDDVYLKLMYFPHSSLPMQLELPRKWFQPLVWIPMAHLIRHQTRARFPDLDFRLSGELVHSPPLDEASFDRFRVDLTSPGDGT